MFPVVFQLPQFEKSEIYCKLAFYMDQARKYIIDVYDTIDDDDTFIRRCYNPFPEDPQDTYCWLCDFRTMVRLWVVSGIYFEHDKTLRTWICSQIEKWGVGHSYSKAIWNETSDNIFGLIEAIGSEYRNTKHYKVLDAFRLIVNVHKHSHGTSYNELKMKYPEYLPRYHSYMKDNDLADSPDFRIDIWLENEQIEEFFYCCNRVLESYARTSIAGRLRSSANP